MKKNILFGLFVVIFNNVLIIGMEMDEESESLETLIKERKTKNKRVRKKSKKKRGKEKLKDTKNSNDKRKKYRRTLVYPKIRVDGGKSVSNTDMIDLLKPPSFASDKLTFEDLIEQKRDKGLFFILAAALCINKKRHLIRRYFDSEDLNRKVFDEYYNMEKISFKRDGAKILAIYYFIFDPSNDIFNYVCDDRALGKQSEKNNFYRTLFKANTGKKKSILKLADLLYNEKNYREAIKYYLVLTKDSDQYAFYKLGLSFCNIKKYEKAIKHLESAQRLGYLASNKILGCIYSEIENLKDERLVDFYKNRVDFSKKENNKLYKRGLHLLNNENKKNEAINKFMDAANIGHLDSINKLIIIYSEDDGSDQVKYYKKQIKIYEKQNSQTEMCINKIKKENCSRKKRNKHK